MLTRNRLILIGAAVIGIPVLAIAWWLLSPLFISKTVDEEFPFAANATVPSSMTMEEANMVMEGMAKINSPMSEAIPPSMMSTDSPTEMKPSVVSLKSGSFRDADSFHRGSGQATIYQNDDGTRVLRLENFSVTNGPDLHVILTPHANPESREDVSATGYVDLGKLKGNQGNQNYVIPEGVDIDAQSSVVIYCQPFHVVFSVASLEG